MPERKRDTPYFFLREDLDALHARITAIRQELRQNALTMNEDSIANSKSLRENATVGQAQILNDQLKTLEHIQQRARVVEPDTSSDTAGLGKTVTVENQATGQVFTKRIGSYRVFDKHAISYESPLAQALIGRRIGDECRARVGPNGNVFHILAIA